MNRLTRLAAVLIVASGLAGCTTKIKDVDTSALYKAYVNQPNNTLVQSITGPNVTWTITGATNIAFYAPIPAKQIMPRETAWYESLFSFLTTGSSYLALWGVATAGTAPAASTIRGATTINVPTATTTTP